MSLSFSLTMLCHKLPKLLLIKLYDLRPGIAFSRDEVVCAGLEIAGELCIRVVAGLLHRVYDLRYGFLKLRLAHKLTPIRE